MSMVEESQEFDVQDAPGLSLSDRMDARGEELSIQRTDWFPVPGYEDILEVQLKPVGVTRISAVQRKNERVRDPDLQTLYNMADGILISTTGFREVDGDKRREIPDDWTAVARRRRDCPDGVTPRQAVLFMLGEERIIFLSEAYTKWVRETRPELDEEVAQDFGRTGSR